MPTALFLATARDREATADALLAAPPGALVVALDGDAPRVRSLAAIVGRRDLGVVGASDYGGDAGSLLRPLTWTQRARFVARQVRTLPPRAWYLVRACDLDGVRRKAAELDRRDVTVSHTHLLSGDPQYFRDRPVVLGPEVALPPEAVAALRKLRSHIA